MPGAAPTSPYVIVPVPPVAGSKSNEPSPMVGRVGCLLAIRYAPATAGGEVLVSVNWNERVRETTLEPDVHIALPRRVYAPAATLGATLIVLPEVLPKPAGGLVKP